MGRSGLYVTDVVWAWCERYCVVEGGKSGFEVGAELGAEVGAVWERRGVLGFGGVFAWWAVMAMDLWAGSDGLTVFSSIRTELDGYGCGDGRGKKPGRKRSK